MSTTKNSRVQMQDDMPQMSFVEHLVAYVTLGLLCGTYQISLILFPVLFGWSYYASFNPWHPSTVVLAILITISLIPINHRPQVWFLKSGIWKIWHKYFDYKTDLSLIQGKLEPSERYLFWEGPHGVWPMGQFLSCPFIPTITGAPFETKFIFGTGAGIIFNFPGVRHVMSWIGTNVVSRKSFTKIFKEGWAAVVAGGIAEMYLGTTTSEGLYIKKRHGTVKMAIQEGAHIIPAFFFGNSRCFTIVGGSDAGGKDSSFLAKFLQRVSRALKASIVFFYGRNYLPIPYRTPLKMVAGNVVRVKQNDNPSDEEIQAVLNQVMNEFERLYADESKRPIWETRPLKLH